MTLHPAALSAVGLADTGKLHAIEGVCTFTGPFRPAAMVPRIGTPFVYTAGGRRRFTRPDPRR